jgi:MATE family multidrug resistance protein
MATEAQNESRALVRRDLAALFALAGPVVISRLGMMTMGLSDAIVVGRYSAIELGWHAIAWAPTTVVLVVGTALLGGVQVMTARAIGEGKPEETGAVLRRGLVYGVWVGLIAAVTLFALGPFLLGLLRLPPDLVQGATPPPCPCRRSLVKRTTARAAAAWTQPRGETLNPRA